MNQFEDMRTFVRIVEAGSISKAAEQLSMVKSAVSRRLTELEKRLGVTLLTRTTRTQKLTESGQSYYQQCIRIIDDVAEIESGIRDKNCALAGRIKIAAPLSFGLSHLGQALRKFNEINPDVFFDIDFNDRQVDLVEEGFDLAIRIAHLNDSSLMARRLTSIRLILCASPVYLAKYGEPKTPEELKKGHVKLHYQSAKEHWEFRSPEGREINIKVPAIVTANNGDYLCQAAIEGQGLLFSPDFICYKAIRAGQLKLLMCDYIDNQIVNAYAVYPQNRHLSQRVRSLIDFLAQYFGDVPYWHVNPTHIK
ncbi:LysR family transcriptional regulator [Aliikangiella sp. IMCC44359]|uniref:LysR family transcriptional regulator n=1 Tax=Aliikangiella sp. IMCC44359 TaxID=3459125 RepID=UPI00403AE6D2